MNQDSMYDLITYIKSTIYTENIVNSINKYAKSNGFILESVSNEADSALFNNYTSNGVTKLLEEIDSNILPYCMKIATKQRIASTIGICEKSVSDVFNIIPIFRIVNTADVIISDMSNCTLSNDCADALQKIDMCNIAACECKKLIDDIKHPMNIDDSSLESVDIDTIKKRIEGISFKELIEDARNKLIDIKSSFNTINPNAYNRITFIKWIDAYSNYLIVLKDAICTMMDYYLDILRKNSKSEANMTDCKVENVFDPIVFEHGFAMFEEDLTNTVKSAMDDIKLESSDGLIGKVRKAIVTILKKTKEFFMQLRAKIMSKYTSRKAVKTMKEVDDMIKANPDILNTKVEYVDYDVLIKQCEDARKALEERMKAYTKLYNDNKDILEKDNPTAQEAKRIEKVENQLREIAYGEGKWSKKKIAIVTTAAAASVIVITGVALYAKYKMTLNNFDKDLSSTLNDTDALDEFQQQVGINTRTSGYSISIAEEYAKILNSEGRLIANRIVEVSKKMMSIATSGAGVRTIQNAASAAVSSAKYLESSEDTTDSLLMSIYEEMTDDISNEVDEIDNDTNDSPDKNEAPVNKVDDVSEETDDYDPMNGLF